MKIWRKYIMKSSNIFVSLQYNIHQGDCVSTLVKVLCYKSEGHWFE